MMASARGGGSSFDFTFGSVTSAGISLRSRKIWRLGIRIAVPDSVTLLPGFDGRHLPEAVCFPDLTAVICRKQSASRT